MQIEKTKVELKEFFKTIRNKIDESENKAVNDLRQSVFMR